MVVFYADCQFHPENLVHSDLRQTKLLDTTTLFVLVALANVTGENEKQKLKLQSILNSINVYINYFLLHL
jgi:hypothetical protein